MDILLGLTSLGSYFNNHPETIKYTNYGNTIKRTPINGTNIYECNNYRADKNYVDDLVYNRYKLSQNPRESGLIPNFYNQMQAVEKRYAEYRKQIIAEQKKKDEIILTEQKANVESRNLIYKQIIFGLIPLMLFFTFISLTMN